MSNPTQRIEAFRSIVTAQPAPVQTLFRQCFEAFQATREAKPGLDALRHALAKTPPGAPGHRMILAAIVAMVAAARSQLEAPADSLWNSEPMDAVEVRITQSLADQAGAWLSRKRDLLVDAPPRCPNCGSDSATPLGETPLMGDANMSMTPGTGLYFDLDELAREVRDAGLSESALDVMAGTLCRQLELTAPTFTCESCGVSYVGWQHDEQRIARYHATRGLTTRTVQGQEVAGNANNLSFAYHKARFPEFARRALGPVDDKRILELGCAEGLMLACFREYGAKPVGFDLNVKGARYGALVLGLNDITYDAAQFSQAPSRVLDAVIAFHSLCHTPKVDQTLAHLFNMLKPGAAVIAALPLVRTRDGRVHGLGGEHVIGFDPLSLQTMFEKHGFLVTLTAAGGPGLVEDLRDRDGTAMWSGLKNDMLLVAKRPE